MRNGLVGKWKLIAVGALSNEGGILIGIGHAVGQWHAALVEADRRKLLRRRLIATMDWLAAAGRNLGNGCVVEWAGHRRLYR